MKLRSISPRFAIALGCGIAATCLPALAAAQNSLPSNPWQTVGNRGTNAAINYIGNSDLVDLVFRTNNINRMRILAGGDVSIAKNLSIGLDLNVLGNLFVGVNGSFGNDVSIGHNITVNNDGTINRNLSVLNDLSVTRDGLFGRNLGVGGDLNVTGIGNFNNTANATSTSTGSIVVAGGAGIGKDLVVGGNIKMTTATVDGTTESTSPTTGALVVAGGTGIGKRLNVGGATALGSTLGVTGATQLGSTLGVAGATQLAAALTVGGATQINNTLGVTGATSLGSTLGVTGATLLSSTLGVTGATQLGSTLAVSGATTLSNTLSVAGNTSVSGLFNVSSASGGSFQVHDKARATIDSRVTGDAGNTANFALDVKSQGQGVVIRLDASTPDSSNHFVDFWDSGNHRVGAITGQTSDEYGADPEQIALDVFDAAIAASLVVASADALFEPADIISDAAQVALDLAIRGIELANIGVSYSSGSGDYAEFLPRIDESEKIVPGDIVGVFGGSISKKTAGAQQVLVVSTAPAVVGNQPAAGRENLYNKVAFLGQVPVRVIGRVHEGDYIVPSGREDGMGIAIAPEKMEAGDYAHVLGRAWIGSETDGPSVVKVIVGLNGGDVAIAIQKQQGEMASMKSDMAAMKAQMSQMMEALKAAQAKGSK